MNSPVNPLRPLSASLPNPTGELVTAELPKGSAAIAEAILDPTKFASVFLQTDLWDTQIQILEALQARSARVAVKACHASSKTFSAAIAVLWFLARFPEAICVTTAPTWGQVEKLLWGEIHSALLRSRYPFPEATMTELRMGPKRYAYGLSTSVTKSDEGVKFQGIHAENVLAILDEAPGVDPKIWEAIEGARAGGNVRILAIGNPTISSGPFHDAFTVTRSGWKCFTIGAFNTPNFYEIPGHLNLTDDTGSVIAGSKLETLLKMSEEELDYSPRPYLTTRRWVKEKFYEWGPGHPLWEARVLGEFPKQSEDALLSLAWLEAAGRREIPFEDQDICAGLDVAGPGDAETSLTVRQGPKILLHRQWPYPDPRGEVVALLNPYRHRLKCLNVDSIGVGWGIYLHMVDQKFPAVPVNVQEASSDSEKYKDAKAEFYWGLRLRFQSGDISGLLDDKTVGQLAGIRYKHNSRGQIEIESKEQAAKRGVESPDRAESIMLAFASRQLVFGALDYFKQLTGMHQSQSVKVQMSDQTQQCPTCSATCVVRSNGHWHCNQCGNDWAGVGDKTFIHRPQTRGEILKKG